MERSEGLEERISNLEAKVELKKTAFAAAKHSRTRKKLAADIPKLEERLAELRESRSRRQ